MTEREIIREACLAAAALLQADIDSGTVREIAREGRKLQEDEIASLEQAVGRIALNLISMANHFAKESAGEQP